MARKPRIEIPGGLYHIITRGNNRKRIFQSHDDYLKFLELLKRQKSKQPFYLYAYCPDAQSHPYAGRNAGRSDQPSNARPILLTSFSQYHNRKYRKVGHLFQGRYKAILCQSDSYLAGLVRYIHLNPVRARIVATPEEYQYCGHRAYIGMDRSGLVDAEPVLRHFGSTKKMAVEVYKQFVNAAIGQQSQPGYYVAAEGRLLGNEEFVDAVKRRIGEHASSRDKRVGRVNIETILEAAEKATGLRREDFCTNAKSRRLVIVKEAIIVLGRKCGIGNREIAVALGLDPSTVSKRLVLARSRALDSPQMTEILNLIRSMCDI